MLPCSKENSPVDVLSKLSSLQYYRLTFCSLFGPDRLWQVLSLRREGSPISQACRAVPPRLPKTLRCNTADERSVDSLVPVHVLTCQALSEIQAPMAKCQSSQISDPRKVFLKNNCLSSCIPMQQCINGNQATSAAHNENRPRSG